MSVLRNGEEPLPMTPAGYEQHRRELDRLRNDERRRMAELLRDARGDGALDDNPALVELLEERAQLDRRIAMLEAQLAAAEITSPPGDGRAAIGSVIRVREVASDEVHEYELVGPIEGDPTNSRISIAAPIGRALLGQRRRARIDVPTPRGRLRLEVLNVATPSPAPAAA
jgi:transcription elongation factor GreA